MREKIDFFISYSHVDKRWAEWIAGCLEQEGYSTFWGERDLKIGDNFVTIIQEYIEKADKLIAIFSPSYFTSTFCQAEVSAMLAKKDSGIIPVKVSEAEPIGDLENILYVDLFNINESEAKSRLLNAVKEQKKQTASKPKFPEANVNGKIATIETKFPGTVPITNFNFKNEEMIFGGNDKVAAIRRAFDKNNTVSSTLTLFGLGGTGKTVMARKYVYQFGYLYNLIWWIDACDDDSILQAYSEFVIKNNLINIIADNYSTDSVVNTVKKWMLETDNWLFVFDNVVDFEIIQSFIPEKHKGNVLITSRHSLWKNSDVNEIKVDVFSTETAIEFLKVQGVNGKNEDLIKLTNALGNLPLSLQMAAKHIVQNKMTVHDFLKQYTLEDNFTGSASTYGNIASVYKEQGDYANALMYYYKSLELLNKEQDGNIVNIYNNIASIYQEMGDYIKAKEIYNKVFSINAEVLIKNSFDTGITYNNLATIFRQEKKYEEAIHLYEKALMLFRENNEQPSIASTFNNLAIVYRDTKCYEKAMECCHKALSIRQNLLGENHQDTAKSYVNLAEIYSMKAEYEKALILYEKALDIYNNVLGEEHPFIADVYGNIATIYQRIGEYQKSLNYYNKALEIQNNSPVSNEFISNSINIIGKDNITNITNISEKPSSADSSKDVVDKMAITVLNYLESEDKDDYKLFNSNFIELQRLIRIIKKELIFETTENTEICHYSKLATLKHIIQTKNSKPQPKLRISNIAYLNDPSEGNVLLQLLKKSVKSNTYNSLFGSDSLEENKLSEVPFSKVFIGSFSTAKNKLPMWTLYGDDSKGCCLVFDDYFFDKRNELIEEKANEDEKNISPQELTLYRVKYIDTDNLDESDSIIGYLNKIAGILDLLESIITKYEEVRTWIITLLDEIRFLFKDCDYDYENEVRIIIHAENSEIKVDDGENNLNIPKLYLDLQRKLTYKEIILGSKIDKPNAIAPFLLHSGMVKKVTKSGINYQ